MDNEQERNEHFKGFAELLWQDLLNANNGYGYIDVSDWDDPTDPTDYLTLIAQRAYDLVKHALYSFEPFDFDTETSDGLLDRAPDLTEWPNPPQP